jgi:hypothetical protein
MQNVQDFKESAARSESKRLHEPAVQKTFRGQVAPDYSEHLTEDQREQLTKLSNKASRIEVKMNTGDVYYRTNFAATFSALNQDQDLLQQIRYPLKAEGEIESIKVVEPIQKLKVDETGRASFVTTDGQVVTIPKEYKRETPNGVIVSSIQTDTKDNHVRVLEYRPNEPSSSSEKLMIEAEALTISEQPLFGPLNGVFTHQQKEDKPRPTFNDSVFPP